MFARFIAVADEFTWPVALTVLGVAIPAFLIAPWMRPLMLLLLAGATAAIYAVAALNDRLNPAPDDDGSDDAKFLYYFEVLNLFGKPRKEVVPGYGFTEKEARQSALKQGRLWLGQRLGQVTEIWVRAE